MKDYDEDDNLVEILFRCEGGPWAGARIELGEDPTTMVFRLGAWRGRYMPLPADKRPPARPASVHWQDVPLAA